METIYLDHNATTPARPEVVESVSRALREVQANPASQHRPGQKAHRMLEDARQSVADVLGGDLSAPRRDRVLFTSGGTEANNLAILGVARARAKGVPGRLVISAVEHASVIEPAEHLMECGWRLDTLGVTPDGVVKANRLADLLASDTHLVSVTLGNHETGVLQPVAKLAATAVAAGVPLHTDATQVAGKLPVDFAALGVAALSVAAHKFGGPLGVGALLLRQDVPIEPLLFGGHQQQGLRPGTEPVALAVGMATALTLWREEQDRHAGRLAALRDRFEVGLRTGFPDLVVNGGRAPRLPQTSNVAFPRLDGQILLMALDSVGVACSVGSACASGSTELSPTLRAMGLAHDVLVGSLRFSFGATTTEQDVDEAVRRILRVVVELKA